MIYEGRSVRFISYSVKELIMEVKDLYSLYPSVFNDDQLSIYVTHAISHFSQDSYEPVVLSFKDVNRDIDLKGLGVNQVLEVITSDSIIGTTPYGGVAPYAMLGFGTTLLGYGSVETLKTYLSNRGQLAQTLKDLKGHLKFNFDATTEVLSLRDIVSAVKVIMIPDYRINLSTWFLADYQKSAFVDNTVQYLVWKNSEIMSKAVGFGAVVSADPESEKNKYDLLRTQYRDQACPPFIGSYD